MEEKNMLCRPHLVGWENDDDDDDDEVDGPSLRFGARSQRWLSKVGRSLDGWSKIYYLELRASEGTLSRL
jgi:hypothetical protein